MTPPKWNSVPVINLSADHIRDLGKAAELTGYEDKLDPKQNECKNEYWNNRYMERNAAITKRKIEKAHQNGVQEMFGRLQLNLLNNQ